MDVRVRKCELFAGSEGIRVRVCWSHRWVRARVNVECVKLCVVQITANGYSLALVAIVVCVMSG